MAVDPAIRDEPPVGTVLRCTDGWRANQILARYPDGWQIAGSDREWTWAELHRHGELTVVELVEKPATPPPAPNLRDGDLDLWVHVRDGLYRLGAGSSLWPREDIDRYYGPVIEEQP